MNKTEFVAKIAEKTGLSKKDAEAAVNAYHDTVLSALKKKDKISFVGFGTYEAKKRSARTARNPQTGQEMKIPAKVVPSMKFSKKIEL